MPRNPERRTQLADAGLAVLAESGARGLTHRAVDAAAGLPAGTASNYFKTRDALLGALGERIFERLAPDDAVLEPLAAREPGLELMTDYVHYIVERLLGRPELTLALLELRLEAARRPGLHEILSRTPSRARMTSLPAPPMRMSAPAPPLRRSFPAPPSSVSSPGPP